MVMWAAAPRTPARAASTWAARTARLSTPVGTREIRAAAELAAVSPDDEDELGSPDEPDGEAAGNAVPAAPSPVTSTDTAGSTVSGSTAASSTAVTVISS